MRGVERLGCRNKKVIHEKQKHGEDLAEGAAQNLPKSNKIVWQLADRFLPINCIYLS
jgi:hypothetical protein